MYAERYAPPTLNRGSLSLSVTIVGSLLTAVMLSPTVIQLADPDKGLKIYPVPPPAPPPPPDTREPPKRDTRSSAAPKPDVAKDLTPDRVEDVFRAPPPDPGPPPVPSGDGGGASVEPVKPPPPVPIGIEIDPRYAANFQPSYPPSEQRAGRDGVVTLKVLVGVDGRVVRAEQVMATSEEFWRVTLKQALGRWRFKPATRDGIPYEAWRTMTVRFRLEDQ